MMKRADGKEKRKRLLVFGIAMLVGMSLCIPMSQAYVFAAKKAAPSKIELKSAKAKNTKTVILKWKKTAKNATGYIIYRKDGSDAKFKKVTTIKDVEKKKYNDKNLKAGTTYTYKVRAYRTTKKLLWYNKHTKSWKKKQPKKKYCGKSKKAKVFGECSKPVIVTTYPVGTVKMDQPQGISDTEVEIAWKAVKKADGYQIRRGNIDKKNYGFETTIEGGDITTFTDSGLKASTTYRYQVRAYRKNGEKTLYGKYSGYKYGNTQDKVEKEDPSQDDDDILDDSETGEEQTLPVSKKYGFDEIESVQHDYGNTTIHLGQKWTQDVYNDLLAGSSGEEHIVRKGYINLEEIINNKLIDHYVDETVYMFDITDYSNFLTVYVANNQIIRWQTTAQVMGRNGSDVLHLGDTVFPKNARIYMKNKMEYQQAGVGYDGVLIGGFSVPFYTYNGWPQNVTDEKRVALHWINAYRVQNGRGTLEYNKYIDGTGFTYTGTEENTPLLGLDEKNNPIWGETEIRTYTDQVFGMQAWAETMDASQWVSHGDSPHIVAGPLAKYNCPLENLINYVVKEQNEDYVISRNGENCSGRSNIGEGCLIAYEDSPGHMAPIRDPDATCIGIGISGHYTCELYANRLKHGDGKWIHF